MLYLLLLYFMLYWTKTNKSCVETRRNSNIPSPTATVGSVEGN